LVVDKKTINQVFNIGFITALLAESR